MTLLQQFKQYLVKNRLVKDGQTVLLAVSGGIDSMVMADLFLQSGVKFSVAHCNFQLRGNDAVLDEELVAEWCKANGIIFHTVHFETEKK